MQIVSYRNHSDHLPLLIHLQTSQNSGVEASNTIVEFLCLLFQDPDPLYENKY